MALYNLTWFHAIVFVTWQFSLIFSLQNLFPIFLNYVPRWMCTSENSSLEFSNNCEIFKKCPKEFLHFEKVFHSSALEFGWICSESATLYTWALSTLQFLGVLIGTTIFGSLADKFGRKPTSIFILSFGILMLALSGLSFELWQFFITRFFVGLTNGGTLVVLYTYCMELVLPEQRMALEFYPNWGTARVVLTMVCYFFPDWRHASFGSCLTSLPGLLLVIFILPESPLWLLTQNKLENLKNCSNKISTISSKDLTEVPRIENEEKARLKNLWDEKKVLLLFSILCYSWFTVSLSAFAIDLNSSTLSGDFFLNQFLFAGVMMISKFILGIVDYLVPQFERRILHNYNQLIAAICFGVIAILVLFKYETSLVLFLSITGTVTIENTFDSCYLITVESMPTGIRSTVLGICSMIARIGALLSPLLVTLSTFWKPTIYTVLAIFGFINFLFAWNFLPETKGVNLAEVNLKQNSKKAPELA